MDNEDKLKALRQEQEIRSKQERVRQSWSSLSAESSLSLKEKLERLLALARETASPRGKAIPPEKREASRSSIGFRVFENSFPAGYRYGKISVSAGLSVAGTTLVLLSRDESFRDLDLSSALFIDVETTGLSGGVGVIPFLIGLAFYHEGAFEIRQFFLGEPSEEEAMMAELDSFLQSFSFRSIISFNGKGFDLPILETRFTLHRLPFPLADLPHLDFIFPARSLWKHKHESCRLFHLAQQVLGADRLEDIPSAEVPFRYFSYLRTGDFSLIEPVLEHNQQDLLSLLGVVVAAAELVAGKTLLEEVDGFDLVGLARILEAAGETRRSLELFEKALEQGLPEPLSLVVKRKLAWHFKKKQKWERAVALWQDLVPSGKLFCFRELAMYYEHRVKDYEQARKLAAEGLSLAAGISRTYERDFMRRLQRLEAKIQRKRSLSGLE